MVYEAIESSSVSPVNAQTSALLLGDTWAMPVKETKDTQQSNPGDAGPATSPEQQMQQAVAEALEGKLDAAAAGVFLRGLTESGGLSGMSAVRDEMNRQLEAQNSDYRARIARVMSPNGQIDIFVVLQRSGENLQDIVTDVMRNGRNSQYGPRAMHFQLVPSGRQPGGLPGNNPRGVDI